MALENPEIKSKLEQLPHCEDADTFEEFHESIRIRAEVVCELIGCKGIGHLMFQDLELQRSRKRCFKDTSEYRSWLSKKEDRPVAIEEAFQRHNLFSSSLAELYHGEKKCHRVWNVLNPGIRCYCDERP
mgnify:FL=1